MKDRIDGMMTTLGESGLAVSRMGLGLAALGRPGYINLGHSADLRGDLAVEAMQARAFEVLDAAHASGVRYFDAARSYGRAEQFLAAWLDSREIEPGSVTIGSKWGYTYTAGWQVEAERHEIKDHSLETLRRQVGETRETLGSWVNLYQIHSATLESGVLDDHAVLNELARLKGEFGWKIGLSLTGPRQSLTLLKAMDLRIDGLRLFDVVQATWNLLEPSCGPILADAHGSGMGVIVKEALANGRLTDRNDDPTFARSRSLLEREAARLGTTIDALSLAAVLARPWVDVVLSGASTVDQLGSNVAAQAIPWDDEAESNLSQLIEPAERYWLIRSGLTWN
jgi:aryl-alcohol dehydrogenase-like predicted oxidoreductase